MWKLLEKSSRSLKVDCVICYQAHIYYKSGNDCAAFLANYGSSANATVIFNGKIYFLPAWSVSILPDCKNVIFNTAKVSHHSLVYTLHFLIWTGRGLKWKVSHHPILVLLHMDEGYFTCLPEYLPYDHIFVAIYIPIMSFIVALLWDITISSRCDFSV